MDSPALSILKKCLPVILLLVGLIHFPAGVFNSNLDQLPGDLGDTRFNNYILEHGYKYITGKTPSFWDAPIFYPHQNTIAFSDNLLGTMPIYAVFRAVNFDRETAFQLWLFSLFALNFIVFYAVFSRISGNILAASVGAYIFAFGLYNVGFLPHVQVFPKFAMPLGLYLFWRFLRSAQPKYVLLFLLALAYQFYCGVYLAFILIYGLLFFFIGYLLIQGSKSKLASFFTKKHLFTYVVGLLGFAAILAPLMLPYIQLSLEKPDLQFDVALNSIPQLYSYFFADPASLTWGSSLFQQSMVDRSVNWWQNVHFPGLLLFIGLVYATGLTLLRYKHLKEKGSYLPLLLLTFYLSLIFGINFNGFTLYKVFFNYVPGFNSMRSMDRIVIVQFLFLIAVFVSIIHHITGRLNNKYQLVLLCTLPVLAFLDNAIAADKIYRFSKEKAQERVQQMESTIAAQYDKNATATAFTPFFNKGTEAERTLITLDAMIAAQNLNITLVNGYSGHYPPGYIPFGFQLDKASLALWLDSLQMDDVNIVYDIIPSYTGSLTTAEGYFLQPTDNSNLGAAQNGSHRFTFLPLENGKHAIISKNGYACSAQIATTGEIQCNRDKIQLWEMFEITEFDTNAIAIRAANGKYLTLENGIIAATRDSILPQHIFFTEVKH